MLLCLLVLLLLPVGPAGATEVRAPQRVIVLSSDYAELERILSGLDARVLGGSTDAGVYIVEASADAQHSLSRFRSITVIPDVEFESDMQAAVNTIQQTDPEPQISWNIDLTGAPSAWEMGITGHGSVVAVIDTGVDHEHPALSGRTLPGVSFVPNESDTMDYAGHGTHVAGLIAARCSVTGFSGVAPGATILPIKVLDANMRGTTASLLLGLLYSLDSGADVVNCSLSAVIRRDGRDANGNRVLSPQQVQSLIQAFDQAVHALWQKGITVVASAGNDGSLADRDKPVFRIPADLSKVLTVSAVSRPAPNQEPRLASYSTYGFSLVDIAAPGGDFDLGLSGMCYSLWKESGYAWMVGTSQAAAHVSGSLALLREALATSRDVTSVLQRNALDIGSPGRDAEFGWGLVDIPQAMSAVVSNR